MNWCRSPQTLGQGEEVEGGGGGGTEEEEGRGEGHQCSVDVVVDICALWIGVQHDGVAVPCESPEVTLCG